MRFARYTVAIALLSQAAFAQPRMLVSAVHGGETVPAAEVCFYGAEVTKPFYALQQSEIRCLPADKILDLPLKPLAFFVHAADRLITSNHTFLTPSGTGFRRRVADLTVGGHLRFARTPRDGEHWAIIIGEGPTNHGMVAPLLIADQRALVPADVPLIPVLLQEGQPQWVGGRVQVNAGGELLVDPTRRDTPAADVIVSFAAEDPQASQPIGTCALPYSPQFMDLLRKQEVPRVELIDADGSVHRPEMTIIRTPNIFDNPYVFRNVSAGIARLRISGRRFVTTETAITISPPGIVMARDAGRLIVGAEITASVGPVRGGVMPTRKTCDATVTSSTENGRELVLWTCPSLANVLLSPAAVSRCNEQHRRRISDEAVEVTIEDVLPGEFLLTLHRAGMMTHMVRGTAAVGETTNATVDPDELFIAGRITRDGRPVQAHVRFHTGEAATDPNTGEYTTLVSDSPGRHPVHIVACDESWVYVHLPKNDIPTGVGYDIDIPSNVVEVSIRDAVTNKTLDGAKLVALAKASQESRGGGQLPVNTRDGVFVVDSLEKGTVLSLCASLTGYATKCAETTVREARQRLAVALDPATFRGRVAGGGYSQITFVRSDGLVSDQARVDGEGLFTFTKPWNDGYAVLTGAGPLYVTTEKTFNETGELVITPPMGAATRTLHVSIDAAYPQAKALLGVWINGLRVPVTVLSMHQRERRQPWFLTKERQLVIQDLLATDRVSIVAGPDIDFLPPGGLDNPMLFSGNTPVEVRSSAFVIQ